MPLTVTRNEMLRQMHLQCPHSVVLKTLDCLVEAIDWCETTMGAEFALCVSGCVESISHSPEEPCYKLRHHARWHFMEGTLYFACRGDALYVKLKWGGTDGQV